MNRLQDKKVLLIANSGFSNEIMFAITQQGGQVDYINDKPKDTFIHKCLGRYGSGIYRKMILEKYYKKRIESFKGHIYDYVLVIRGEYTPAKALEMIKKQFPKAKLILYMWDSLQNNPYVQKKFKYFNKVWTFDRKDYLANRNRLLFLPLFYCERELPINKNITKYDLAFIGTGHEDRLRIIKQVQKQCADLGLSFYSYIYLPHPIIFYFNKLTNRNYRHVKKCEIHFSLMKLEDVYQTYSRAKCILDIESKTQTGLTMRTIENLGLKKKLLTTNSDVAYYDFYNPYNISIIDREKPSIDKDFFIDNYKDLDSLLYESYSIKEWVANVLLSDTSMHLME